MIKTTVKAVLIIEDNLGDVRLLREMLSEQDSFNIALTHVASMGEAERYLAKNVADVVLLDLGLPDAQGMEAVRRVRIAAHSVPLVVLTGFDDESLADQALQEGAQDYLVKGQFEKQGLLRALRYATERNRLDQLKDEFISSVSHELRTPLTSISGSLGLLIGRAGCELSPPAARLVAIAYANSQRLVRLVNDILDIEKMESGGIAFDLKRVDVRSLIEQTIAANQGFAEGHGIRICLDAASAGGDVRADADRLIQVVTNLLSNAIKFSPPKCDVTVKIENEADMIRISVRDHGDGIPDEFRPRMFDRFSQADATNAREKGGTGLGLSIVKQIVDRLAGKVGFTSVPSGGTLFYVTLPLWTPVASRAADFDVPAVSRILFCGDDLDTALALRDRLGQIGFATDFAYTAKDGLESAEATQYHGILVSRGLSDGGGIGMVRRLRESLKYLDAPIIVVSDGPVRADDNGRSSKLNVSAWLQKPVDFDRLVSVLGKPAESNNGHPGTCSETIVATRNAIDTTRVIEK